LGHGRCQLLIAHPQINFQIYLQSMRNGGKDQEYCHLLLVFDHLIYRYIKISNYGVKYLAAFVIVRTSDELIVGVKITYDKM
jgi:hypothetical protein